MNSVVNMSHNVARIRHQGSRIRPQGLPLIGLKLFMKKIFFKKDEKCLLPYYLNNFLLILKAYLSNFGSKTSTTLLLPATTKILKFPIRRNFSSEFIKCINSLKNSKGKFIAILFMLILLNGCGIKDLDFNPMTTIVKQMIKKR